MASSRYFCEVGEAKWRNVIPLIAVESVKAIGEGDCGGGAGGFRDGSLLRRLCLGRGRTQEKSQSQRPDQFVSLFFHLKQSMPSRMK
jgi:hypothetical protein